MSLTTRTECSTLHYMTADKTAKVLLIDGRVLRVTEARETAQGLVFVTTLGERVPAAKILRIKERAA